MTKKARTALIAISITLVVIVAIGVIYSLRTSPPESGEPAPSPTDASPSQSETQEPTTSPSPPTSPDPSSPEGGEPLTEWSEPLTPACGESLSGDDLDSALEFTAPPERISPEESFPVGVYNTESAPITAEVDRYDFAVPVLTDSQGLVVAMAPLEPVLAEGYSVLALAGEDELDASGTLRWAGLCEDDGADLEDPSPLPEGEYNLFLFASTVPEDDGRSANQVQGGPFPITVDASATHEVPEVELSGGPQVPDCGDGWTDDWGSLPATVEVDDGDPLGEDGLVLSAAFTVAEKISGANVYGQVIILDDGVVTGPRPHASDSLLGWYASAGLGGELTAVGEPVTCAGDPLAPGDYEAVLVVSTINTDAPTLAVSEPVPFTVQ